jgi:predicted transcriptional regulator
MSSKTTSVRISEEYHRAIVQIAEETRPRSTIQYVIEDAIEKYLKDKGVEYGTPKTPNKKS